MGDGAITVFQSGGAGGGDPLCRMDGAAAAGDRQGS